VQGRTLATIKECLCRLAHERVGPIVRMPPSPWRPHQCCEEEEVLLGAGGCDVGKPLLLRATSAHACVCVRMCVYTRVRACVYVRVTLGVSGRAHKAGSRGRLHIQMPIGPHPSTGNHLTLNPPPLSHSHQHSPPPQKVAANLSRSTCSADQWDSLHFPTVSYLPSEQGRGSAPPQSP